MERRIPYKKLSKKERKALDARRRVTWAFSPATRRKESAKAYSRKRKRRDEDAFVPPL